MPTMMTAMRTQWGVDVTTGFRQHTADWNVLYSCLVEDEYQIANIDAEMTPVGIDIGAHIGGATLAMMARGMYVVSVEPLPENAELLRDNIRRNMGRPGFERAPEPFGAYGVVLDAAIGYPHGGEKTIWYNNLETEFGSVHEHIGSNSNTGGRSIRRPIVSLDNLIEKYVPPGEHCAVKIDCEGAEWDVFDNMSDETVKRVDVWTGESHPTEQPPRSAHDVFDLLVARNIPNLAFQGVQLIGNAGELGNFIIYAHPSLR